MSDRLAEIERRALSVASFQRTMARAPKVMAADVLALVEVAKAARVRQECGHDDTCSILYGDFSDLAKGVEPLAPCDCGYAELAAALSALDGEEGEA